MLTKTIKLFECMKWGSHPATNICRNQEASPKILCPQLKPLWEFGG